VSRTDAELVADALEHLRVLRQHLGKSTLDDQTVADAVSLRLAAAIESVSATSHDLRHRVFGDDWRAIWATRNRIAHGYAFIDVGIIRATVEKDLAAFETALRNELDRGA
jgi:uncharacterized protein with HEPN domain